MLILAIDPGPEKSSWVLWGTESEAVAVGADQVENQALRAMLGGNIHENASQLVIERPVIMGQNATAALLETSRWAGVFEGSWPGIVDRLTYHRVRCQLANSGNAKESEVKQALISRFAPSGFGAQGKGTKANPGPFYGVTGHMWSAVAVAVAWWDQRPKYSCANWVAEGQQCNKLATVAWPPQNRAGGAVVPSYYCPECIATFRAKSGNAQKAPSRASE